MENISFDDAQKIRSKSNSLKMEECSHNRVAKEYYLGTHSDYVCLDCGFSTLNKEDFNK